MRSRLILGLLWVVALSGCAARTDRLSFPREPISRSDREIWYDTDADGKPDFGMLRDGASGGINTLEYDDDEDGKPDRIYHLSDYDSARVPHLIILLDSIPYPAVADRYARGEFGWFDPPQKVIPPFPSMSEQIFSRILHAPPLPGVVDDGYDRRTGSYNSGILQRFEGSHQPWEYRCHYAATYAQAALSYIQPRSVFRREIERVKRTLDESPDRVTIVYLVSTSGMLCKYARQGLNESLDEVQRLCLEILHERQGAVKISICADHGHNLKKSQNIHFEETLRKAGFHPTDQLRKPKDVVLDLDGLVTYLGVHTNEPAAVADVILTRDEVELVTYLDRERVIVKDHSGAAAIERRDGHFRYTPIDGDPLGYRSVIESLRSANKIDSDGFVADEDWFTATINEQFPDGPRRLWDAFHGLTVSPPDVMLTVRDGYCAGDESLRQFINMMSTHGGLNQVNSATFLLTMTGRATRPMRSYDIIPTVEPNYAFPVRKK